jgi:hypothetical protein
MNNTSTSLASYSSSYGNYRNNYKSKSKSERSHPISRQTYKSSSCGGQIQYREERHYRHMTTRINKINRKTPEQKINDVWEICETKVLEILGDYDKNIPKSTYLASVSTDKALFVEAVDGFYVGKIQSQIKGQDHQIADKVIKKLTTKYGKRLNFVAKKSTSSLDWKTRAYLKSGIKWKNESIGITAKRIGSSGICAKLFFCCA